MRQGDDAAVAVERAGGYGRAVGAEEEGKGDFDDAWDSLLFQVGEGVQEEMLRSEGEGRVVFEGFLDVVQTYLSERSVLLTIPR